MRVTIRDLAKASGVSAATVSYVINEGPRSVRPETRQRVLEAMRRLDYQPNAVARALSSRRTNAIGIVSQITGDAVNFWFASLLQAVLASSVARGQHTALFVGARWADIRGSIPIYREGRCDGLLLLAPPNSDDMARALLNKNIPFVLVNEVCDHPLVSHVDIDNESAMETLVAHVIRAGHRRIALLGGDPELSSTRLRHRGYVRALAAAGLRYDADLALSTRYDEGVAYRLALELMRMASEKRPTAVCCGNDPMAFGAMAAIADMGLRVPDDVSVTGFDDVPPASMFVPPLTTVRQPFARIGELAVDALLTQLNGGSPYARKEVLPAEVVLRASVAPPKATGMRPSTTGEPTQQQAARYLRAPSC